jgi:hypothetical protein
MGATVIAAQNGRTSAKLGLLPREKGIDPSKL